MKPQRRGPDKHSLKVFICGKENSGKTTLMNKFLKKETTSTYNPTFRSDMYMTKRKVENSFFNLQICDMSGNEKYLNEAKVFIKDTSIALVIYDITSLKSSDSVLNWLKFIREASLNNNGKKIVTLQIGNKGDKNDCREVPYKEGQSFAKQFDQQFFETSAQDLTSVGGYENITKIEDVIDFGLKEYQENQENIQGIEGEEKQEQDCNEESLKENLSLFQKQIADKIATLRQVISV